MLGYWNQDPAREGGFKDLLTYDPASEELRPTRALGDESELISNIAQKWGTGPSEVMQNLELRAKVQTALVEAASELKKPELLEAGFVVRSNLAFHALLEKGLQRGRVDYRAIFRGWRGWLQNSGI